MKIKFCFKDGHMEEREVPCDGCRMPPAKYWLPTMSEAPVLAEESGDRIYPVFEFGSRCFSLQEWRLPRRYTNNGTTMLPIREWRYREE
jgi:hypothetical protein